MANPNDQAAYAAYNARFITSGVENEAWVNAALNMMGSPSLDKLSVASKDGVLALMAMMKSGLGINIGGTTSGAANLYNAMASSGIGTRLAANSGMGYLTPVTANANIAAHLSDRMERMGPSRTMQSVTGLSKDLLAGYTADALKTGMLTSSDFKIQRVNTDSLRRILDNPFSEFSLTDDEEKHYRHILSLRDGLARATATGDKKKVEEYIKSNNLGKEELDQIKNLDLGNTAVTLSKDSAIKKLNDGMISSSKTIKQLSDVLQSNSWEELTTAAKALGVNSLSAMKDVEKVQTVLDNSAMLASKYGITEQQAFGLQAQTADALAGVWGGRNRIPAAAMLHMAKATLIGKDNEAAGIGPSESEMQERTMSSQVNTKKWYKQAAIAEYNLKNNMYGEDSSKVQALVNKAAKTTSLADLITINSELASYNKKYVGEVSDSAVARAFAEGRDWVESNDRLGDTQSLQKYFSRNSELASIVHEQTKGITGKSNSFENLDAITNQLTNVLSDFGTDNGKDLKQLASLAGLDDAKIVEGLKDLGVDEENMGMYKNLLNLINASPQLKKLVQESGEYLNTTGTHSNRSKKQERKLQAQNMAIKSTINSAAQGDWLTQMTLGLVAAGDEGELTQQIAALQSIYQAEEDASVKAIKDEYPELDEERIRAALRGEDYEVLLSHYEIRMERARLEEVQNKAQGAQGYINLLNKNSFEVAVDTNGNFNNEQLTGLYDRYKEQFNAIGITSADALKEANIKGADAVNTLFKQAGLVAATSYYDAKSGEARFKLTNEKERREIKEATDKTFIEKNGMTMDQFKEMQQAGYYINDKGELTDANGVTSATSPMLHTINNMRKNNGLEDLSADSYASEELKHIAATMEDPRNGLLYSNEEERINVDATHGIIKRNRFAGDYLKAMVSGNYAMAEQARGLANFSPADLKIVNEYLSRRLRERNKRLKDNGSNMAGLERRAGASDEMLIDSMFKLSGATEDKRKDINVNREVLKTALKNSNYDDSQIGTILNSIDSDTGTAETRMAIVSAMANANVDMMSNPVHKAIFEGLQEKALYAGQMGMEDANNIVGWLKAQNGLIKGNGASAEAGSDGSGFNASIKEFLETNIVSKLQSVVDCLTTQIVPQLIR